MNPEVKKGDKIILKKSVNGAQQFENTLLEVCDLYLKDGYFYVMRLENPTSGKAAIYTKSDDYVLASRKDQATFLKIEVEKLKAKVAQMEQDILFYEKFETEEDFVAYKLNKIIKAKGPDAIAKVLKELKTSNYI